MPQVLCDMPGTTYNVRSHDKRQVPAAGQLVHRTPEQHHSKANRLRYKYAMYAGEVYGLADYDPQQFNEGKEEEWEKNIQCNKNGRWHGLVRFKKLTNTFQHCLCALFKH